jgi:hypothetical protein
MRVSWGILTAFETGVRKTLDRAIQIGIFTYLNIAAGSGAAKGSKLAEGLRPAEGLRFLP